MKIILLGAPGSGKGTQAENLMRDYDCPQISTGVLLRKAVAEKTEIGKKVEEIMARGDLVSDEIVLDLIQKSLEQIDDQIGFLLDGYPRNINQAKSLNLVLESIDRPLEHTVLIDVDAEILIKRLSGRRTCSITGKTLNIYFSPKKEIDDCIASGGELIQRDDDNIESISKRIEVYGEQTEPMIEFYRESGILQVVNGEGSIEEVYKRLLSKIN
tara:strand:- start:583 stop:1224 length:642 start_codon:yes stop_codon:yes gene_type:complete